MLSVPSNEACAAAFGGRKLGDVREHFEDDLVYGLAVVEPRVPFSVAGVALPASG